MPGKPALLFGPVEPVWLYEAPRKEDFYSSFLSGAQRLPNGNTLICAGAKNILFKESETVIFEVTPDKDVVWKYISPFEPVFRAYRYGLD